MLFWSFHSTIESWYILSNPGKSWFRHPMQKRKKAVHPRYAPKPPLSGPSEEEEEGRQILVQAPKKKGRYIGLQKLDRSHSHTGRPSPPLDLSMNSPGEQPTTSWKVR